MERLIKNSHSRSAKMHSLPVYDVLTCLRSKVETSKVNTVDYRGC